MYGEKGKDALRFGQFANQLGDRLLAAKARALQMDRDNAERKYIGQVFTNYTGSLKDASEPEDIMKRASMARGELFRLGTPKALQAGNALDEEMRLRMSARQKAQQPQVPKARYGWRPKGGRYSVGSNVVQEMEEFDVAGGTPTGQIKYEKFSTRAPKGGGGEKDKEKQIRELERKKKGLEKRIWGKYGGKINLHKLMTGEAEIPFPPEAYTEEEKNVYKDPLKPSADTIIRKEMVKTLRPGAGQDKDILNWLDTAKQLENEYEQQNVPYEKAEDYARKQLGTGQAQPTAGKKTDAEIASLMKEWMKKNGKAVVDPTPEQIAAARKKYGF